MSSPFLSYLLAIASSSTFSAFLQLICNFYMPSFQLLLKPAPSFSPKSSHPVKLPWILRPVFFFSPNVCLCSKRPFALCLSSKLSRPTPLFQSHSLVHILFLLSINQNFIPHFLILLQIFFLSSSTLLDFLQMSMLPYSPRPLAKQTYAF